MKRWTFGVGGAVLAGIVAVAYYGINVQADDTKVNAGPAVAGSPAPLVPFTPDPAQIERGRYLVQICGCNDCHTSGYLLNDGAVPERDWLTGDTLGWRGPWGTTYGKNLRKWLPMFTEDQWVFYARNVKTRPPMPWYVLRQFEEKDLRAIYQFVRHLGPAGNPEPAYVPPGQEPPMPYATFPAPPPSAGAAK